MLNKGQQLAVDSTSKRILCLAGAGTGKTHTMLSRISRLVSDGVNTHDILVLTFTNAAAFEMLERYKLQHPRKVTPTFSTFHAFCYKLIASDEGVRKSLGYTSTPSMPDEDQLKQIDISVKQQCGITLTKGKLEGKLSLSPKERFQFDLYWKKFKQMLRQQNLITFDIMCYDVCKLFVDKSELVQRYIAQYKYIFVDEFQDTDTRQWEFVCAFNDANIFVVGDVLQAIYQFRGADNSIIKKLADDESWETLRLVYNYRSTKQICKHANNINKGETTNYKLDLVSDVDGDLVRTLDCPNLERVSAEGLELIQNIKDNMEGTCAILCRANSQVHTVKDMLDQLNISYNSNVDNTEVMNILKCVMSNEFMVSWLSTMLRSEKYIEWIKLSAVDETYSTFEGFYELYGNQFGIRSLIKKISFIRNILHDKGQLPYKQCVDILHCLGIRDLIVNTTATAPSEIVAYLIDLVSEVKDSDLYVGTVHSVKGLEYDEVHVLGVESISFRIDSEELRNIYYVGCTRAKSRLSVYFDSSY